MKKIHACLRKFGLNDDEFTLAPTISGILVYDIKAGFIWFPNIVMEALGAPILKSQITESIGNNAGQLGGVYAGGVIAVGTWKIIVNRIASSPKDRMYESISLFCYKHKYLLENRMEST